LPEPASALGRGVFAIVLPFVGVLVYLGTQGEQMAEHSAKRAQAAQAQADDYVRSVAGSNEGPAPRSKRPSSCSTAAQSPRPSSTRSRRRRSG